MAKYNNHPIGIFDSGIGGLTVASAIRKLLPNESIIYFGDTAHMPYGDKSPEAIKYYSLKIGKFLQQKNCKLIVIACNTASSLGYDDLKEFLGDKIPIINVIDPIVEYLVSENKYQHVGVIGTKATIKSGVYEKKIMHALSTVQVHSLATPLLAPMIEEGFFMNNISKTIINSYLCSPKLKQIQTLILACTHYPLIKNEINDYFGHKIEIINTAEIVSYYVQKILKQHQLESQENQVKDFFYVSDKTNSFENSTKLFFGNKINLILKNIWN